MKTLVAYDSNFGNTKMIADEIARVLGTQALSVKDIKKTDLEGLKLFVIGSPINNGKPTPGTTDFLNSLKEGELKGVTAASFDTRKGWFSGDAKDKIARELTKKGAVLATMPEAFNVKGMKGPLVDGTLERARAWAKEIASQSK